MTTIGEEDRPTTRANLGRDTGYTGISILHRLFKLYGFNVITDLVVDMMHNLPMNVAATLIKKLIEEEKIDTEQIDRRLKLMPWPAGIAKPNKNYCVLLYNWLLTN